MTYQVVYQRTPFAYTSSHMTLVEADSKEEAFVTVYDHLARAGDRVQTDEHSLECYLQKEGGVTLNRATLAALGVPMDLPAFCGTIILRIDEYKVRPTGKIL